MKKIIALFAFIVLSVSVYSQTNNWYFSLSMGGSVPLGTFSKTDINNKESGYAKSGFDLMLDATYPLNNHWGLKGAMFMSTNPVDLNGLGTKLETRMNAASITVADADRKYLSLLTNSWMWNSLLVGPVYTVNINRANWDFQLLGGMNVAYLPQQKMQYEKPSNSWYYLDKNTTTTSVSYGIMAGTAFRFPVSDRINLRVGIDYYRSQASIKYDQVKVTKEGETTKTDNLGNGSSSIPIEMLSGTIGLVYYLN